MVSRLISKMGVAALAALAIVGCMSASTPTEAKNEMAAKPVVQSDQASAIFAGGCFWCIESDMDGLNGVISTTSGYTAGSLPNPTYKTHSKGKAAHYEAVQVVYDPKILSYDALLTAFWHSVDVTDDGGQFCDRGDSYRTAVFATAEQRPAAEASKAALADLDWPKAPVLTPILPVSEFFPAEVYHQDYHTKNPIRYRYYRNGCGRDKRVKAVWGPLARKGLPTH